MRTKTRSLKRGSRLPLIVIGLFTLCFAINASSAAAALFPLNPLTKEEIASSVRVLKQSGKLPESYRCAVVTLREPPKEEVLRFKPGDSMRRESFCVLYDRKNNKTYEAVVDLIGERVVSLKEISNSQPPLLLEDFMLAQLVVQADPRWQQAMMKRGIQDFKNVQIDAWPAGYYAFPDEKGARIVRALSYYRGKSLNCLKAACRRASFSSVFFASLRSPRR